MEIECSPSHKPFIIPPKTGDMSIAESTRLGPYTVLSPLGAGGMGEVYLAEDTRLHRKVALKILPADLASNRKRMQRFNQEAMAAAALNHPHIAHIYEIGSSPTVREGADASSTTNELHFIAMEHIDGETLRQRTRARMKLTDILDIATQTASALAAAHAAGIVHRDIKPENVMVRHDGYVKVLDFGLAKLTEHQGGRSNPEAATMQVVKTDPGRVVGTAHYMSPEQARGQEINEQTDIWSLGVVLYEMATAMVPFPGQTGSDVLAAILKTEPLPLRRHTPDIPSTLQRIVRKALRKDREERYQLVKELGLDLKDLRRELELNAEIELSQQPSQPVLQTSPMNSGTTTRKSILTSATGEANIQRSHSAAEYVVGEIKSHAGALALGMGVIGLVALTIVLLVTYRWVTTRRSSNNLSASSRNMRIARVTSTGNADKAAISPDGKYLVHITSENGQQSLRVRQVSTNSDVQIVAPSDVQYAGLTFSHDGDFINYVASEKNSSRSNLYQIPGLGGNPRRLIANVGTAVAFSTDGQQLAFIRNSPDA